MIITIRRYLFAVSILGMGLLCALVVLSGERRPAYALLPTASETPAWGPDIRVNPIPAIPYTKQRNYSLAVNPTNSNNVLAGYDGQTGVGSLSSYASSSDAGRTWTVGHFSDLWGDERLLPLGNASIAFDAQGVGYYANLAVGNISSGYLVLTTTNGTTWSTPVPIALSDYNESRQQAVMRIDPSVAGPYAGRLYIFWVYTTRHSPYFGGVQMRYSTNSGLTWSGDVQVSDPSNIYSYSPVASVARDGSVYAAFQYVENYNIFSAPHLFINRSTDGGLTWGADYLISNAPIVPIGGPDWKQFELTLVGSASCNLMRINHFPSIAVSPKDSNTVYAVWNDGRWEPEVDLCGTAGRHSDIAFSRSTDAGHTWTSPIRLNDDPLGNGIDQFQPTISVREDGLLGVTWYDRRYSYYNQGDQSKDIAGYLCDLVHTQSSDGGLTWSGNQKVSDFSSDPNKVPDYKGIEDMSYRTDLVYGPDYVLTSWLYTPEELEEGAFYVDRGTFAQPNSSPMFGVVPPHFPPH